MIRLGIRIREIFQDESASLFEMVWIMEGMAYGKLTKSIHRGYTQEMWMRSDGGERNARH